MKIEATFGESEQLFHPPVLFCAVIPGVLEGDELAELERVMRYGTDEERRAFAEARGGQFQRNSQPVS